MNVCEDVRQPPLSRCPNKRLKHSDYCYEHAQQAERQDRLRGALKINWVSTIGARGRPARREFDPEDLLKQAREREGKKPDLAPPEKQPDPITDKEARRRLIYGDG